MHANHFESGGRYPVLRTVGILYLVGSVLALVGGIFAAAWALFRAPNGMEDRWGYALIALAATFFVVLTMLAVAELLKLMIDIEHNTRMSVERPTPAMTETRTEEAMRADGSRRKWLNGEETAEGALLRGH